MTTREDVARIAAGLTKAHAEILANGAFPAWQRELRETRMKSALVKKGLATFHHVIAGRGDFCLTTLGEQVRNYLIERARS